jgi:4-hydroxybenzoate polyprenyltransferase
MKVTEAFKKLFIISRPISWPNTAYPFAAGYLISGGSIDLTFIITSVYFLIPYNLLMYGINDVFDYESDIRNPRKGGIEGAVEQKTFHPTIIWTVLISNLPFALWIFLHGTLLSNSVFAMLLFFVVAYSISGLRFKEIPVLDSVTSSIHFIGPLVFAFSVTGFLQIQLPFIIAFFLWGIASHALGAIQDIIPDREGGLSSIATFFGARVTMAIVFCFYLISCLLVMFQGIPSIVVGVAGLAYIVNIIPYLHVTDASSTITNKAWKRFIWLNLFIGFITTLVLIISY